jgi:hypothetical protein
LSASPRNVYLLVRDNFGGIAAPLGQLHAAPGVILNTAAMYRSSAGTASADCSTSTTVALHELASTFGTLTPTSTTHPRDGYKNRYFTCRA